VTHAVGILGRVLRFWRRPAPRADSVAPTREPPELIFDGQDLLVRAKLRRTRTLVVTFSSRGARAASGGHRAEGFGERLFDSQDVAFACFINKGNHWWQTLEAPRAIEVLRDRIADHGYERIITYGASMGAYGALIFSKQLGATDVLAFSPQYSISGEELPIQPDWRDDMRNIPVLFEPLGQGLSETASITVAFDPLTQLDLLHVRALEKVRPVRRLVVPFSGHSTALFMGELSLLKPLVLDLIGEGRHPSRAAIRAARRGSARYWSGMAGRQRAKGRDAGALSAIVKGTELVLSQEDSDPVLRHGQLSYACTVLLEKGQAEQALALAERNAAAFPRDCRAASLRSRMLRRSGKLEEALEEARRAKLLGHKHALPLIELACSLLSAGRTEYAQQQLLAAMRKRGATWQDWIAAATAFEQASPSVALGAARLAMQMRPRNAKFQALVQRLERSAQHEASSDRRPASLASSNLPRPALPSKPWTALVATFQRMREGGLSVGSHAKLWRRSQPRRDRSIR
jgi:tetratricopeptide (TPR) repeat protein